MSGSMGEEAAAGAEYLATSGRSVTQLLCVKVVLLGTECPYKEENCILLGEL